MNTRNKFILGLLLGFVLVMTVTRQCHHPAPGNTNPPNNNTNIPPVAIPPFSADSAYAYTKAQVDFGPRIPGSKAHEKCLQFMVEHLKRDSLQVNVQSASARTFDGKEFRFENVIASVDPQNQARIVFFTHWDTRPWADLDSIDTDKPFDGADDGASGVGVLLELARHLHKANPGIGVDIVFLDLEDYGQQSDADSKYPQQENTWCLGSQYWAKNLPPNYAPRYGILLDMVGGKNAVFPMEGTSLAYAPQIIDKVWNIAAQLGYGNYFTREKTAGTIDDHLYINKLAGIPTIDIVHYEVSRGDYPYFHHRHSDNMSVIDAATMQVVGNTLMAVIYAEKNGNVNP